MTRARKLISCEPANDLLACHPALDFFPDKAIVTIKEQAKLTFEAGKEAEPEVDLQERFYTICSNGHKTDHFWYSKGLLADFGLFYAHSLDVPMNRWDFGDMMGFVSEPKPIDFAEVYPIVKHRFTYYLDFQDARLYDLFSTFIVFTYFYPLFGFAPILHLFGEFQTGKTKICQLIEAMGFNPINSSNISEATVFRMIQGARAIVILDESEDLLTAERSRGIRNMLLAGIGKTGKAYRQEKIFGDRFQTQSFNVFSPKVVANIAGINLDALVSRLIRVTTTGTTDKTMMNREVDIDSPEWQVVRNMLYRLCLTQHRVVREAKDNLPDIGLAGRPLNIWQGLLTIAHCIGGETEASLQSLAVDKTAEMADEIGRISPTRLLLRWLLLNIHATSSYTTTTLYEMMSDDDKAVMDIDSLKSLGMLLSRMGVPRRSVHRPDKQESMKAWHISLEWLEARQVRAR